MRRLSFAVCILTALVLVLCGTAQASGNVCSHENSEHMQVVDPGEATYIQIDNSEHEVRGYGNEYDYCHDCGRSFNETTHTYLIYRSAASL